MKTISPSFGTGFGETSFENPSKLEIKMRKQNTHLSLKKRMPSILHEKLNYVPNKISQTDLKPEITNI